MNEPTSFDPTPHRSIRKAAIIAGGFVGIFTVTIGVLWGIYYYQQWQGERAVTALHDYLQEQSDAALRSAMADTYGGSTPQETLQMYIDAVEKGDYELASRYFIESKRSDQVEALRNAIETGKISDVVTPLREALNSTGEYSENSNAFSFYKPVGVDMILYPNNIWKLVEI